MSNAHTPSPNRSGNRSRDRIWVFLGSDGRHVNAGRYSDPSEEEIKAAGESIAAQGLAGWLAIREGDCLQHDAKVNVLKVRLVTPQEGDWDSAVRAFEMHRWRYLADALG